MKFLIKLKDAAVHEYLTPDRTGYPLTSNNIIVDKNLYDKL